MSEGLFCWAATAVCVKQIEYIAGSKVGKSHPSAASAALLNKKALIDVC